MSESLFEPFEQSLRARWYSQPALSLEKVQARWGTGPWPAIIRYRVLSYLGGAGGAYRVSDVSCSLAAARKYAASLRALGIGRHGPYPHAELRIRRTKLRPLHVLLKVRIPVLMPWYEPPHVVPLLGLLYAPSGRVKAFYQ